MEEPSLSGFDPSGSNPQILGAIGFDRGFIHFTCSLDESDAPLIGSFDLQQPVREADRPHIHGRFSMRPSTRRGLGKSFGISCAKHTLASQEPLNDRRSPQIDPLDLLKAPYFDTSGGHSLEAARSTRTTGARRMTSPGLPG